MKILKNTNENIKIVMKYYNSDVAIALLFILSERSDFYRIITCDMYPETL